MTQILVYVLAIVTLSSDLFAQAGSRVPVAGGQGTSSAIRWTRVTKKVGAFGKNLYVVWVEGNSESASMAYSTDSGASWIRTDSLFPPATTTSAAYGLSMVRDRDTGWIAHGLFAPNPAQRNQIIRFQHDGTFTAGPRDTVTGFVRNDSSATMFGAPIQFPGGRVVYLAADSVDGGSTANRAIRAVRNANSPFSASSGYNATDSLTNSSITSQRYVLLELANGVLAYNKETRIPYFFDTSSPADNPITLSSALIANQDQTGAGNDDLYEEVVRISDTTLGIAIFTNDSLKFYRVSLNAVSNPTTAALLDSTVIEQRGFWPDTATRFWPRPCLSSRGADSLIIYYNHPIDTASPIGSGIRISKRVSVNRGQTWGGRETFYTHPAGDSILNLQSPPRIYDVEAVFFTRGLTSGTDSIWVAWDGIAGSATPSVTIKGGSIKGGGIR